MSPINTLQISQIQHQKYQNMTLFAAVERRVNLRNKGFVGNEQCQFFHNDRDLENRFNGFLSKDAISFGKDYSLDKQIVGRILNQNKNLVFQGINGFLGVGPSSYQNLFNSRIDTVFSLCSDSGVEGGGYLVIGGIDRKMMKGNINWIQFSSYQYYNIPSSYLKIGNVVVSNKLEAVIDTKYEFIIVDDYTLQNIKREIQSVM